MLKKQVRARIASALSSKLKEQERARTAPTLRSVLKEHCRRQLGGDSNYPSRLKENPAFGARNSVRQKQSAQYVNADKNPVASAVMSSRLTHIHDEACLQFAILLTQPVSTEPYPAVKKLATARAMTPHAVRTGGTDAEISCMASSRFTNPTSIRAS